MSEKEKHLNSRGKEVVIRKEVIGGRTYSYDQSDPIKGGGGGSTAVSVYKAVTVDDEAFLYKCIFLGSERLLSWEARRYVRRVPSLIGFSHPNVVKVHAVEYERVENCINVIQDFVEGKSLRDLVGVSEGKKLSVAQTLSIAEGVLKGLVALHTADIVHRDIKPDNIMISNDGTPVIVDFGIIKTSKKGADISLPGFPIGTPHYMSKE